jgi:hypothetical protein
MVKTIRLILLGVSEVVKIKADLINGMWFHSKPFNPDYYIGYLRENLYKSMPSCEEQPFKSSCRQDPKTYCLTLSRMALQ